MASNPLDRIQSYFEEMTKTDKDIALYVLNNPRDAARGSISQLAALTGTSKSALVRFSNRIGYSGFAEFKFDLSRFLVSRNAVEPGAEERTSPITSICEAYASYIKQISESITDEDMRRICEKMTGRRRIKIFGYNRTYNSALQLKQRLGKIGVDAEAAHDYPVMEDIVQMLTKEDLLIVFTISDNSGFFGDIIHTAHDNGCPVICFTMTQALPFRRYCDEYIVLPRISRDNNISFLDDQAVYFVFIEILLDCIAGMTAGS